jgi:cellulose synthase/poly-beta-1,6-N-acetylglucosamine synthase-like glycosyltransferase
MRRAWVLLQLPLACMVVYLDVLAVAATRWRPRARPIAPRYRFALLVPAHNEELLLPRLLQSFADLAYPPDLYDVHVVADNCTDNTAVFASAAGAFVHERTNLQERGKGYALRWLLTRLAERGLRYDAYVIIDADSVVSANLLAVLSAHLAQGDQAIQCYYGVLNAGESWPSALRYVALTLFNGLRPRGRDTLRLSAGLRGNGMCFAAPIIERFGWDAFTLAEDAEFHLVLVGAGVRVAYAGEATVLADMPTSLRQSQSQNVRWERGRLHLLRTYALPLLADAVRRRDAMRLDAVAEGFVPPLAVLMGLSSLSFALTAILRLRAARRLSALVLLGQALYTLVGLRLAGAGVRAYLALFMAPVYIVWKVWIYLIAAIGLRGKHQWVRTERSATPSSNGVSVHTE